MISLKTIVSYGVLRKVWKEIRNRERLVHLTQAPLVRDSTGGLAFELSLSEATNYLSQRVLDGYYRPHSPLEIEAAKSKLLRRRLSFLLPEDALIFGALVQATRGSLLSRMSEWVNFGRAAESVEQKKKFKKPPIEFDYEGWWTKWMRYRNLLKVIAQDPRPHLVVSDVVNFFGSVDLSLLRSRVSGVTSLDGRANDLLFFLLDRLRPSKSYGPKGSLGLPVVSDDASRVLAHFYLTELDDALLTEGKMGRYTRWVDDMVVSVADETEGGKIVARIERALSQIGLVANSSKTRVISKADFRKQHYEDDNEYLDEVHDKTNQGTALSPRERQDFDRHLSLFLASTPGGYWSRALRRYYTESRRVRSKKLAKLWDRHLQSYPTEGQHVFDYISFYPGSLSLCEQLFRFLKDFAPLFEDLQLLAYETLLLTPFPDDAVLRSYVVLQTYHHYLGLSGFERPTGYVRGLQSLVVYKFGGPKAVGLLAKRFTNEAVENPDFATYAFPVIAAGSSHWRQQALAGVEHIDDPRILRLRTLVSRLLNGDELASRMLLGLLEPRITISPSRAVVNPRALPLLGVALQSTSPTARNLIQTSLARIVQKVTSTGEKELIDRITLSHLK